MGNLEDARAAGRFAMRGMRRTVAERVAEMLRRDPERLAAAVDAGLVRREWLEDPAGEPISNATPVEMVERFLQRSVEQRPSVLSSLGLSAIQALSAGADDAAGDGTAAHLAVAFTDLEGFTAFTSREGDEAASRLLADHRRLLGPIVRSRGGRVVKYLGDGTLLTFPAAEAAVLACLELVDVQQEPLRLRAGLHAGDVVVVRDDLVGHVVNVAARVAEAARGGEVLVTAAVAAEAAGVRGARFGRPRHSRLKGVAETVDVCVVTAEGRAR